MSLVVYCMSSTSYKNKYVVTQKKDQHSVQHVRHDKFSPVFLFFPQKLRFLFQLLQNVALFSTREIKLLLFNPKNVIPNINTTFTSVMQPEMEMTPAYENKNLLRIN